MNARVVNDTVIGKFTNSFCIPIVPFPDGNGRVGRLIALKECLRFGLIPFIIEDAKKMYYYRGLSEWEREKGYLTDTCLDGQDTFKKLMSKFDTQS